MERDDVDADVQHATDHDDLVNLDFMESGVFVEVRAVLHHVRKEFESDGINQRHEDALIELQWNDRVDANDDDDADREISQNTQRGAGKVQPAETRDDEKQRIDAGKDRHVVFVEVRKSNPHGDEGNDNEKAKCEIQQRSQLLRAECEIKEPNDCHTYYVQQGEPTRWEGGQKTYLKNEIN